MFLVEDEALIRIMMTDMLEELGHIVVAEAANIKEALALAQTADFEIAILDINFRRRKNRPHSRNYCAPSSAIPVR